MPQDTGRWDLLLLIPLHEQDLRVRQKAPLAAEVRRQELEMRRKEAVEPVVGEEDTKARPVRRGGRVTRAKGPVRMVERRADVTRGGRVRSRMPLCVG